MHSEPGELPHEGLLPLLRRAAEGDREAAEAAVPIVYEELRRLARAVRHRHGGRDTLNTTALVHEAYLRIAKAGEFHGESESQFYALAAKAMRTVLIDYARSAAAAKRGGDWSRTFLDDAIESVAARGVDIVELDEALHRLAILDDRKARLVELRVFAGASDAHAAETLGVSVPTIRREWRTTRAWLRTELGSEVGR